MDMCLRKLWEIVKDGEAWCATDYGVRHDLVTEQQQTLTMKICILFKPEIPILEIVTQKYV